MIYKTYNFKLILRLVSILLNFIAITYAVIFNNFIILPVFLLILCVFQIGELIHQVNITNRSLIKFLDDVKYQDVNAGYGLSKFSGSFKELENSYKEVLIKIKEISHEKESSLELLNNIVEQINVGLIVIDDNKNVKLMNSIAQLLLNCPNYKSWYRFKDRRPEFADFVENLNQDQSDILTLEVENQNLSLSITRSQLIQFNKTVDIITVVSIGNHLGKNEVDSYNRLISVLTHEIMNTISPIVSLSKVIEQKLLQTKDSDLSESIKIIGNRSEGLLDFVKNYRKISKIPEPNLSHVLVFDLLNDVKILMQEYLSTNDIIKIDCTPKSLEISMDKTLIEQSLINLVKNSIEAKSYNEPLIIELIGSQKNGKTKIEIIDNGKGISEEIKNDVLVPFYTSKNEGTGIGLSIANQVMVKHNGMLDFNSRKGKTVFTLDFGLN